MIGVVVGVAAARGGLLTTGGVALSARARTIRDWSMVWLRDYARPVRSTHHTCCDSKMRDQIRLAFGSWGADEEQAQRDVPANGEVS